MFYKLSTNFPPERGAHIQPERAAAILEQCMSFGDQSTFDLVVVDKPIDGSLFVYKLSHGEPLPEDGYGWLDDETAYRTYIGEREMEILSRNQGFGYAEQFTYMTRRRYKLAGGNLQLLHYVRVSDPAQQMPVHHHLIKVFPRDPKTLNSLTSLPAQPTQAIDPYANMPRRASAAEAHRTPAARRPRQKSRQSTQRPVEEDDDPSGDELDSAIGRVIALDRYKRNHEFMDMIFSPHSTMHLVPVKTTPDDTPERIAAMKQQIEAVDRETGALLAKYAEEMARLRTSTTMAAASPVEP
ncbi:hypothetical protein HDU89_001481 [Geranomyces variabilis]|nr:hypothetical protein HDU89_001481 [Geranomyces variabilis]